MIMMINNIDADDNYNYFIYFSLQFNYYFIE